MGKTVKQATQKCVKQNAEVVSLAAGAEPWYTEIILSPRPRPSPGRDLCADADGS
jgi:hypothetical protein